MFWKHFTPPVSELDTLLANEDCTLSQVLDAEDVLQECKGINNKLLKFLTRDDNIEELVTLITVEPLDDGDETERFKHPNTACNVLTSGAGAIIDKLLSEEEMLDKLFEFMKNEQPLNSLLASFFSRVVVELFSKKPSHMLTYVSAKEGLVDSFVSHIDTSAIMDLLMGIVSAFQTTQERAEICKWMDDHSVVEKLIDLIRGDVTAEKQRNASRALTELHRHGYEDLSMNYDNVTQDNLLDVLESNETVERLMGNILASRNTSSPWCHGPEYICSVITLQQMGVQTGGMMSDNEFPHLTNEDAARRIAECTIQFLPGLIEMLRNPPPLGSHCANGQGQRQIPLGAARLSVIRLLTSLAQVGCPAFDHELARLNLGTVLIDLFLEYKWNSFLHTYVDQFIGFVLGSSSEAAAKLATSLIHNGRLLQRLACAAMENEMEQNPAGMSMLESDSSYSNSSSSASGSNSAGRSRSSTGDGAVTSSASSSRSSSTDICLSRSSSTEISRSSSVESNSSSSSSSSSSANVSRSSSVDGVGGNGMDDGSTSSARQSSVDSNIEENSSHSCADEGGGDSLDRDDRDDDDGSVTPVADWDIDSTAVEVEGGGEEDNCTGATEEAAECVVTAGIDGGYVAMECSIGGKGGKKRRRRGYMGHIVSISNALLQTLDLNEDLRSTIEEVETDELDEWRLWVDGPLETVNRKNNIVLGGTLTKLPGLLSADNSDEDIPISAIQQTSQIADAFSFYQTQQMTADFADSFGFEDEDFTGDFDESDDATFSHGTDVDFGTAVGADGDAPSLFEQACSERLQHYSDDDVDSSDARSTELM